MAQDTLLITEDNFVTFENVWVKAEEPDNIEIEIPMPLILITPPFPEPQVNPLEPEVRLNLPKKKKLRKCDQCNYTTPFKHCIDRHLLSHSLAKAYKCAFCEFRTKTKTHLKRHVEMKHKDELEGDDKIYACHDCDYKARTGSQLTDHRKLHRTNRLKCTHCNYSTVYRKNLERHSLRHTKTDKFQCDKCPFQSKYQRHLFRHLSRMHNDISKEHNSCDLCGYTNKKIWKLKNHIMLSKRNKKLICDCGFTTFYKCEIRKHSKDNMCEYFTNALKDDADGSLKASLLEIAAKLQPPAPVENTESTTKYKCNKCSAVTQSNSQLQRHMLEVHVDSIKRKQCDFCDYTTHDTYRLNKHIRLSKSNDLRRCMQCDFSTMQKCAMRNHNRTAHFNNCDVDSDSKNEQKAINKDGSIKPENFSRNTISAPSYNTINRMPDNKMGGFMNNSFIETKKAGLTVPRSYNEVDYGAPPPPPPPKPNSNNFITRDEVELKNIGVLNSYDKDKPFQCVLCEFKSQYKVSVQKHYLRRHMSNDARPYKCMNCSLATKTKDKMQTHNKRSQSETILTCKYCPYTSYFKCSVADHVKTHYTVQCRICNHVLKDKRQLQKHHETYHSKNKLKCQFCEFTTVFRENLLNHENIHKGIKPYKCNICDYAAVRMPLLTNHYKTKHNCAVGGAPLEAAGVAKKNKENIKKEKAKKSESTEKTDLNVTDKAEPHTDLADKAEPYINKTNKVEPYINKTDRPNPYINRSEAPINNIETFNQYEDNKSHDSYHWPTNYYDHTEDYKTASYKTYQADRNTTASSISMEDWPDHHQVPEFRMFDGNPEQTQYSDYKNENSMEVRVYGTSDYTDLDRNVRQVEATRDLSANYIVTEQSLNLLDIQKTDDKEKSNKCALCDFKSKHKAVVQTHYLRKHTSKDFSLVKCIHCEYTTKTKDKMIAHVKRSQSGKERICKKCPFRTYFRCAMTFHKKSHQTFRCRICKIHFLEKSELEEHQATKHSNNKLKCHFCDFLTTTKPELVEHENLHKQMKQFKCNSCDYRASRNTWLINHIRKRHPHLLKKKDFIKTEDKKDVKVLISTETAKETNEAAEIISDLIHDNYIVNKSPNTSITGVLRSDDKEKPFKCVLCDYKSQYKFAVQKHFLRLHTDNEAFKCINCEYSTKTKDKIGIHITRSKSDKELSCQNCDFRTFFKCTLNEHERERHYDIKCNICGQAFKSKHQLYIHHASYHKDHEYKCQFCDYTTARKPSLIDHENIHKGVKPFKCDYCDYSGVKRSLVTNHVKKQHPDNLKEYEENWEQTLRKRKVNRKKITKKKANVKKCAKIEIQATADSVSNDYEEFFEEKFSLKNIKPVKLEPLESTDPESSDSESKDYGKKRKKKRNVKKIHKSKENFESDESSESDDSAKQDEENFEMEVNKQEFTNTVKVEPSASAGSTSSSSSSDDDSDS